MRLAIRPLAPLLFARLAAPLLALLIAFPSASLAQAPLDTLKVIRDTGTIRLGYRASSPPFSFAGADRRPTGYSIDLCKHVVSSVQRALGLATLRIEWVPVTPSDRFDHVASGAIDLECGTTTVTLRRMERVGFSSLIFVDGGSMLVRADSGLRRLEDLVRRRVAVVEGTTAAARLGEVVGANRLQVTVVPYGSEPAALGGLRDGKVDAYANDRLLLAGLAIAQGAAAFALLEDDFSVEPYALVMRRDDSAFRVAVNRALSELYRSPELTDVYARWFGGLGRPSMILQTMYMLGAFGE